MTCPSCLYDFKKYEALIERGVSYCSVACKVAGRNGLYWHVGAGFANQVPQMESPR